MICRHKRPLEVDLSTEPPAKVARVGDYNYEIPQSGSEYAAYYQNYYGYDYSTYASYAASYDPSSSAASF